MKKNVFLISIFFFVVTNYLRAQSQDIDQTFRPVLSAGLLTSQIDGSSFGGSKLGYFFGLGINRQLSKVIEVEFALTLLQKGLRSNYKTDSASLNNPNNSFSLIRLNYLEIPMCIKFNYKRFKAEVGGAMGYLIKNPPFDETQYGFVIDNGYKNFDYSFLIGGGYKLKKNLLLNVRWEYSMVPVRPYPAVTGGVYRGILGGLFNKGLYNNVLQITLNYKLPSKPETNSAPVNAR
ncbi:MAG: outer membrane beta-barrel protein [Bacteroidia bacterium]